jgi:hypothetical protein
MNKVIEYKSKQEMVVASYHIWQFVCYYARRLGVLKTLTATLHVFQL